MDVALVGYGYAARTFHAPLIAAAAGLRLTRAAVRSAEAAAAAAEAGLAPGTLDEVLADPSISLVVVATPTADHAAHAAQALSAGKFVVVDKPLATASRDAKALEALARRSGRLLTVFHNRRWDADFLGLRAVLDSGVLGELVELTSAWDRFHPLVRDRWRERAGSGAGVWWDLGSHLMDQALQLFGPPAEIAADIGLQRLGATVADRFQVRLLYASGLRVTLESRSLALAPAPRFVAHGTRGSYVKRGLDPQEAQLRCGLRPGAPGWGIDPIAADLTTAEPDGPRTVAAPCPPGDYGSFYPAVRDTILYGREPPVRAGEAAEVVRLLELAEESVTRGCVLAI